MKKYLILITFLFFSINTYAQGQILPMKKDRPQQNVDYPEVPRVSAYEASAKYKSGKAILIHVGGQDYKLRHIMGALNFEKIENREDRIIKLPKDRIEIFTYCY